MANNEDAQAAAGESGGRGGVGKLALALALLVGASIGGGAGAFVAGPLLAKKVVAEVDHLAEEAGEHRDKSHAGESKGGTGVVLAPVIENVVINPARSGGTRFLMLSLSLGVADEVTATEIKARDVEIRDVVIGVLGKRGVNELASHELRDTLKKEVATAVDSLMRRPVVRAVYFPQYVIQ